MGKRHLQAQDGKELPIPPMAPHRVGYIPYPIAMQWLIHIPHAPFKPLKQTPDRP